MKRKNLAWIAGAAVLLPFAYGMGATALIRATGYRVMKRLPERKGIALTFDARPRRQRLGMDVDAVRAVRRIQAHPFYPGYSADFFDGRHFVMKGGSR